ncbi:MAG TPA: 3-deoxy-manno-octulosonate cytidylyltransferase [Gemmataceae bacterium]
MRAAIVIPARYASSRLPGKPLLRSTGKYLVQHVYERALQAKRAAEVLIATDDPRILAAARSFGARAVLTHRNHASGTDRVAEVARGLNADVVVNLQGDEPLIDPADLDRLPELLDANPDAAMATLAVPVRSLEDYLSPHCVKVVCDDRGHALYFSRSPVPAVRDGRPDLAARPPLFLHHLGLYAYRREVLLRLAALPPSPLEQAEKLEQLRALSLGWKIQVGVVADCAGGVDTWEEYRQFVREYRRQSRPGRRAA